MTITFVFVLLCTNWEKKSPISVFWLKESKLFHTTKELFVCHILCLVCVFIMCGFSNLMFFSLVFKSLKDGYLLFIIWGMCASIVDWAFFISASALDVQRKCRQACVLTVRWKIISLRPRSACSIRLQHQYNHFLSIVITI